CPPLPPPPLPSTSPSPPDIYTLSLHDALPICAVNRGQTHAGAFTWVLRGKERVEDSRNSRCVHAMTGIFYSQTNVRAKLRFVVRSEEHTSELQSRFDLVCRLLLEKKK